MRVWRVGSISMGISLLFLGIVLLLSKLFHLKSATILVSWWPIILIVLGAEILVYLLLSKQEKPIVKYDMLSIFFVGCIGMVGIGLTIITTTGILEKVNEWSKIETNIINLPEYEESLGDNINRVVINTGSQALTIDGSQENDVSIFGIYRAQSLGKEAVIETMGDYLLVKEKGDTLYVQLKDVYHLSQPFQDWVDVYATMILPSNIALEVNGEQHNLKEKRQINIP